MRNEKRTSYLSHQPRIGERYVMDRFKSSFLLLMKNVKLGFCLDIKKIAITFKFQKAIPNSNSIYKFKKQLNKP